MLLRNLKKLFLSTISVLFMVSATFLPAGAAEEELPGYVKEWQEFARKMGKKEITEWAKRLADPGGIKLGKSWTEYLGYDAPSLVKANDPAPEIKPGTVITTDNYQDYPGLKKLLPPTVYDMFKKDAYVLMGDMVICPTIHYYPSKGRQKNTKNLEGQSKIVDKTDLSNWKAGYPFPHLDPTSTDGPAQLWQSYDIGLSGTDDWEDDPVNFLFYNRKNVHERTQRQHLRWKIYNGRNDNDPIPCVPDTPYREKGSLVVSSPFDIAGIACVKTRYINAETPDDFVTYIPSLRRVRVMSGSDTQDPLVGSDYTWDDWRGYWQKCSGKVWPTKLKYLGEAVILAPVRGLDYKLKGSKLCTYWEKRPCWKLEILTGGDYIYAKRIAYIGKELFFGCGYNILYDARSNFWKNIMYGHRWWPEDGRYDWRWADMIDYINMHRTIIHFEAKLKDVIWDDKFFSIRFLSRYAR